MMNYFSDTTSIVIHKNKVVNYLLNTAHPDGWSKAKLFIEYGFHPENWEDFAKSVTTHTQNADVIAQSNTPFGTKVVLKGVLETPSLRTLKVQSVWIVFKNIPILVAIYPSKQ